jgi:hypothetical protein
MIKQNQSSTQTVKKTANDNLRRRVSSLQRKSIAFVHQPQKPPICDEPLNGADIADATPAAKCPTDTAASGLLQQSCVAYLFLPGSAAARKEEKAPAAAPQPHPPLAPLFEHRRLTQLPERPTPPDVAAAVRAAASPIHARLRLDTRRAVAAFAPPHAAIGGGATWRRVVYDPVSSLAGAKKLPHARRPAPDGPDKTAQTAR